MSAGRLTASPAATEARHPGASENQPHAERLRQSEARLRAAIDATQGILWTNDAEGRMVGDQPAWSGLTGQGFDEYQGFGWASAVHPEDAGPTVAAWKVAVETRSPFIFEHRVRRHDGAWRRFAIRAMPVLDDAGQIREWVGVHTDITEATEARSHIMSSVRTFAALIRNSPSMKVHLPHMAWARSLSTSAGRWPLRVTRPAVYSARV